MKWQPEPFTNQDMDLVLEYNGIMKGHKIIDGDESSV